VTDPEAEKPSQSGDLRVRLAEAFRDIPELETSRLRLRKIRLDDAEDMFAYARDPETTRWVSWDPHRSLAETRRVIDDHFLAQYDSGEAGQWALVHKAIGKMIGTAGLRWNEREEAPELGFAIAREYWNRGLMTEAVHRILRYGFEDLKLERVVAKHASTNPGSGRVLAKAGMHCEGPKQVGKYRPIHYSLTKSGFWAADGRDAAENRSGPGDS
jgi:ribosomal-protein-alanine N-acetyltransferase